MSNMDPFDEFEFKPLTDGLGFHKKTMSLKEGLKNSGVLEDELHSIPNSMPKGMLDEAPKGPGKRHTFEDVLSALEKTPLARSATSDLQFTEPLPRNNKREAMDMEIPQAPVQSPFPQPGAYKTPTLRKSPASPTAVEPQAPAVGTRRGAADSPPAQLVPETVNVPAAFLDGIIVLALSLVFLIALLTVTKVDMGVVMTNLGRDTMTKISLIVLFVSVMQMYVIIGRSFFGRTLGEWTFDVQLGRDEEQKMESYPVKVAARSLLNTVTGLVVLPLLSFVMGRDIAGQISGLQLYRQNT